MTIFRPGEFDITDRAVEIAEFRKGSRILDIGCGEGDTVRHLAADMSFAVEGIDKSTAMIKKARETHPGINVRRGDGEELAGYGDGIFDGVFMECVLSLFFRHEKALQEVYRVLKAEGKLIISDLYCREERTRSLMDMGAFNMSYLIRLLKDIGYQMIEFEDRTIDLGNFVADFLMKGGSLDELLVGADCGGEGIRLGYFLLVAKKISI